MDYKTRLSTAIWPIEVEFTPGEFRVVLDRLNVPDAIADVLTDDEDRKHSREEIETAAFRLATGGNNITLTCFLDLEIVMDAIEGSTVPARTLDALELSGNAEDEAWARNTRRHFRRIERKFGEATGVAARFPKY